MTPSPAAPAVPTLPTPGLDEVLAQLDLRLPEPLAGWWAAMADRPLLQGLVIVALGAVLAQLANALLVRVVPRLTRRTSTKLDDGLLAAFRRPVFMTISLLAVAVAARRMELPERVADLASHGLLTLVVLSWLLFGLRSSRLILDALTATGGRPRLLEERTIPLFNTLAKIVVVAAGGYALLQVWNVDATAWLTSAGIVGIAVGFAAKDTLANLFAGLFIVADAPYKLGDFIVLESGERGRVTHVGIRSTRILTRDDVEITLPNAVIANSKIVNESGGPWPGQRIRVPVSVAYGSDVEKVLAVLEQVAVEHPEVVDAPRPAGRLRSFGESGLALELLCWIEHAELRGRLIHELNLGILRAFAREGIEIPFPQRVVHLREPPGERGVEG